MVSEITMEGIQIQVLDKACATYSEEFGLLSDLIDQKNGLVKTRKNEQVVQT